MPEHGPDSKSELFLLPLAPGKGSPTVLQRGVPVFAAVKHAMALPADQQQRAVIRTRRGLMFFPEIEAVYETALVGFPCAA